jgi:hypothetical protein
VNKQVWINLFYGSLFVTFAIAIFNFVFLCDQSSFYFSVGLDDVALEYGYLAEATVLLPSALIIVLLGVKRYCSQ